MTTKMKERISELGTTRLRSLLPVHLNLPSAMTTRKKTRLAARRTRNTILMRLRRGLRASRTLVLPNQAGITTIWTTGIYGDQRTHKKKFSSMTIAIVRHSEGVSRAGCIGFQEISYRAGKDSMDLVTRRRESV